MTALGVQHWPPHTPAFDVLRLNQTTRLAIRRTAVAAPFADDVTQRLLTSFFS
jgi:hypothetical protein